MADVFISYAREDRGRIQALVRALEAEGLSVWWDPEIRPGVTYRQLIEQELRAASAVVVAWSRQSIGSHWVQDEAEEGRERGVLIPVLLEPVRPPAGFRQVQAADLSSWRSSSRHPEFQALVGAIRHLLPVRPAPAPAPQPAPPQPPDPGPLLGDEDELQTVDPAPPPPRPAPAKVHPAAIAAAVAAVLLAVALWPREPAKPADPVPDPAAGSGEAAPPVAPTGPIDSDILKKFGDPQGSSATGSEMLGSGRGSGSQAAAVVNESLASAAVGSLVVVFGPGETTLSDSGQTIVSQAARRFHDTGASRVVLTRTSGVDASPLTTLARAQAVESALVAAGVPRHLIFQQEAQSSLTSKLGRTLAFVTIEVKP